MNSQTALTREDLAESLKAAASYRSQHPYKTGNAEKDRIVEELLAKVSSETEPPASVVEKRQSSTK
jgi:hypothetical protein